MSRFIKYDNQDGDLKKIISINSCPDGEEILQTGNIFVTDEVTTDNLKNKLYNALTETIEDKIDNTVTLSKTTVTADEIDKITLSNIPTGAVLTVTGEGVNATETVLTGSQEITFDTAGDYKIYVDCFPLTDYEVNISAT